MAALRYRRATVRSYSLNVPDTRDGVPLEQTKWQHETRESHLCRFLRARKFDIEEATKMYNACVEWRKAQGLDELGRQSVEETLGCREEEFVAFYRQRFLPGLDREGRAIYYEKTGTIDMEGLLSVTSHEQMLRNHVRAIEVVQQPLCARGTREVATPAGQPPVDSVTTIMDMDGLGTHLINSTAYAYVRDCTKIDQDMYPEMAGHVFIINAPSVFTMAWKMVKGLLDERTVTKIRIMGGPEEWQPALHEVIDPKNLPPELGGTLELPGGVFPPNPFTTQNISSGKKVREELPADAVQLRWWPKAGTLVTSVEYEAPDAEPVVLAGPNELSESKMQVINFEVDESLPKGGKLFAVFDGSANWRSRDVSWRALTRAGIEASKTEAGAADSTDDPAGGAGGAAAGSEAGAAAAAPAAPAAAATASDKDADSDAPPLPTPSGE